jgi:flagellar biosynthesis regulator FlaF
MGSPLKPHLTEDEWFRFKRVARASHFETPEHLACVVISDRLQHIEKDHLDPNRNDTEQIDVESPLEDQFSENVWYRLSRVTTASEFDIPEELIAEVISSRLSVLEDEYFDKIQKGKDLFNCSFVEGVSKIDSPGVQFAPTKVSKITFEYKEGNRGNTNIMDTETTVIGKDEIIEKIEEAKEVAYCSIPQTGSHIDVYPEESIETPLDLFAEEIHNHLLDFIEAREEKVNSGDETKDDALKRAMRGYL